MNIKWTLSVLVGVLSLHGGCADTMDQPAPARDRQPVAPIVSAQSAPRVHNEAIRATMKELDRAFKNVGLIRSASWGPPPGHPDLNAIVETDRIRSLLSELADDPAVAGQPASFRRTMQSAVQQAQGLRAAMNCANTPQKERHYESMTLTCATCHAAFRD